VVIDTFNVGNDRPLDTFPAPVSKQFLHTFDSSEFEPHAKENESANNSLTPFAHTVSPLARSAAEDLQNLLQSLPAFHNAKGKMFGVLVVRVKGEYRYLAAYSGKLDGQWHKSGFVPPPFDTDLADKLLLQTDISIKLIDEQIQTEDLAGQLRLIDGEIHTLKEEFELKHKALSDSHKQKRYVRRLRRQQLRDAHISSADPRTESTVRALDLESSEDKKIRKTHRREYNEQLGILESKVRQIGHARDARISRRQNLSKRAQIEYFKLFHLLDRDGNRINLVTLGDGELPPAGTGECAGAKLLGFALNHDLEPIAMAEFWWGPMPDDEVRHHGNYYPCCRSKCGLLIPALLAQFYLRMISWPLWINR